MVEKNRFKIHISFFGIVILVFIWSAIKPAEPFTWILEVTPVFIGLLILIFSYRKFAFFKLSYLIITVLMILMLIGSHYTYERVPLFTDIKHYLNLKRNEYDRVGHFAKGFFALVIREFLIRKSCLMPSKLLIFLVLSVVLALAAGYEIIEWIAAEILGRSAKDFLGTQGDIWDSEWDMALAVLGSILSLLFLSKLQNKMLK